MQNKTLHFTKMHGCGNDYIYFNCFEERVKNPEELSIRLSDRHFGVGGDGIVLICPSKTADARMPDVQRPTAARGRCAATRPDASVNISMSAGSP